MYSGLITFKTVPAEGPFTGLYILFTKQINHHSSIVW